VGRFKVLFLKGYIINIIKRRKNGAYCFEKTELPLCQSIKIDQYEFKRVEQFKYLSTVLTGKKDTRNEVGAKIQTRN